LEYQPKKEKNVKTTIGIIGGMSWQSTKVYYELINSLVSERLGGLHSAKCIVYSVDFAEVYEMEKCGDWDGIATLITHAATSLRLAGASILLLASNTMHKVFDRITHPSVQQPHTHFIHIVNAISAHIPAATTKVGLLGTKITMEDGFYQKRMKASRGIEIITPALKKDQNFIDVLIHEDLCQGKSLSQEKKDRLMALTIHLEQRGVEGVILGCTELPLAFAQIPSCGTRFYDSCRFHVEAAVEYALYSDEESGNFK
jgi:aspartate racemase